jgi:hypothetical protein
VVRLRDGFVVRDPSHAGGAGPDGGVR